MFGGKALCSMAGTFIWMPGVLGKRTLKAVLYASWARALCLAEVPGFLWQTGAGNDDRPPT